MWLSLTFNRFWTRNVSKLTKILNDLSRKTDFKATLDKILTVSYRTTSWFYLEFQTYTRNPRFKSVDNETCQDLALITITKEQNNDYFRS
jgi:hypothetical protein